MSDINVVPYIDVMLVLLIIFMITAPLVTQGVKVELPRAASEPIPPDDNEPVIVTVDRDGNYYVNYGEAKDKPIAGPALVERLSTLLKQKPKTPVFIEGDAEVAYKRVVELMSLLQGAGVDGVGLITEPTAKQTR